MATDKEILAEGLTDYAEEHRITLTVEQIAGIAGAAFEACNMMREMAAPVANPLSAELRRAEEVRQRDAKGYEDRLQEARKTNEDLRQENSGLRYELQKVCKEAGITHARYS
jgi:glutamate-1-semialdehyde aminotransferase